MAFVFRLAANIVRERQTAIAEAGIFAEKIGRNHVVAGTNVCSQAVFVVTRIVVWNVLLEQNVAKLRILPKGHYLPVSNKEVVVVYRKTAQMFQCKFAEQ
jgi:hypothetical protein